MKYKRNDRPEPTETPLGHIEWLKSIETIHKQNKSKRLKLIQTLIKENIQRLNENNNKKDHILFGG